MAGRVNGPARLLIGGVIGLLVAVALLTSPPGARALDDDTSVLARAVRGAIHVHSRRSDGSGTAASIAAAAARAGLDFVVLTDHGDAARLPDRPAYHEGVLVIDGVEVSTDDGHVVAVGLPRAPYPLGGEARDVVEDIARLGGFSVAAHPDSPRDALRWRDWEVPVDAIEWVNGDSAWRDEGAIALLRSLITYPVRPTATVTALLERPDALLERWDALTQRRRVVALAGSDAHARLGVRRDHRGGRGIALPLPGYATVFRAFSVVLPDVEFAGDAPADAARVVDAFRNGRVYSAIDGIAGPARLDFGARSGAHTAAGGDILPIGGAVVIEARTNAPADARIVLFGDGRPVAEAQGARLEYEAPPARGVYRVEVHLPGGAGTPAIPWMLSNPIYVGWPQDNGEASGPPPRTIPGRGPRLAPDAASWSVEASAGARGAVDRADADATGVLFRYALGGTRAESPFVAFVTREVAPLRTAAGLQFRIWAERPMRLSIQVRRTSGGGLDRWHRSVYADDEARDVVVRFDDMRPRGDAPAGLPDASAIESLLVVIDTVHTALGSSGRVRLEDLAALPAAAP
jgi:hypothetical protein